MRIGGVIFYFRYIKAKMGVNLRATKQTTKQAPASMYTEKFLTIQGLPLQHNLEVD